MIETFANNPPFSGIAGLFGHVHKDRAEALQGDVEDQGGANYPTHGLWTRPQSQLHFWFHIVFPVFVLNFLGYC